MWIRKIDYLKIDENYGNNLFLSRKIKCNSYHSKAEQYISLYNLVSTDMYK